MKHSSLAALIALALFAAPSFAQIPKPSPSPSQDPSPEPTFEWGSFATTQTLKTAAGKRQIFGARVAASMALGYGARAVVRMDFTGLPDGQAVDPSDPTTFQAVDFYAGVHGPTLFACLSLAGGGGIAFDIEGGKLKPVEHNPVTLAGGVRCALGHHSTVYVLIGRHDPAGPGVKMITTTHVFVSEHASLIVDVALPNGYQRAGVAYRIK
jgi:hypothetical protein